MDELNQEMGQDLGRMLLVRFVGYHSNALLCTIQISVSC